MIFLTEATYIRYVIANYQNLSKSAHRPPQIPFYRGFFENQEGPGTSFQATLFIEFFDKTYSLVMLHKLAKVHHQTMFTSQVIQQNVFCVSWLGI